MKKLLLVLSILGFVGCMPGPNYEKEDLVNKVAFDKDCPATKVEVTQAANLKFGGGDFKVSACGKKYTYILTGTVYQEVK